MSVLDGYCYDINGRRGWIQFMAAVLDNIDVNYAATDRTFV